MKQVNVRLDEKLVKEIKIICIEHDISLQEAVKMALEEWVINVKQRELKGKSNILL
ncbi:MAG: hypothetical protein ACOY46_12670 [Bacillota bacterium]